MAIHVDAIYRDGTLHPQQPLALPEGALVRVQIETSTPAESANDDPLADVIGIGEGPAIGDAADRHDDYLCNES